MFVRVHRCLSVVPFYFSSIVGAIWVTVQLVIEGNSQGKFRE